VFPQVSTSAAVVWLAAGCEAHAVWRRRRSRQDGRLTLHTRIVVVFAIALVLPACGSDGADTAVQEPRTGYGNMGLSPPPANDVSLFGPDFFPCHSGKDDVGYTKYGVGRMRRGGLEREKLEPNHIVIDGHGVNFHGNGPVVDGGTIEMEMDEDYFEPTVLKGAPGATVTIELENEGVRQHNFSVPGQHIDITCGVRARDVVKVVFPSSGLLAFTCKFGATSGMRGALAVA
jgi:plastocyanin